MIDYNLNKSKNIAFGRVDETLLRIACGHE